MSVDMSARAVTQRLKTLEELWELSVELMKAKRSGKSEVEKGELREERSLVGEMETEVP